MMIEFTDVTITYLDGTAEVVTHSTRQHVADGVLHLFKKNGSYAAEEHLGSWPLTSVKKWVRKPS
jgi:hypothetical protein